MDIFVKNCVECKTTDMQNYRHVVAAMERFTATRHKSRTIRQFVVVLRYTGCVDMAVGFLHVRRTLYVLFYFNCVQNHPQDIWVDSI